MLAPRLCAGLLATASCSLRSASAQDTLSLDPSIAHVVSGGRWSTGASAGSYRVIVRTGGYEHITSELTLQWLEESHNAEIAILRSVVVVNSGCTGRLDGPQLRMKDKRWQVAARCTPTHGEAQKPFEIRVALGAPGIYELRAR